VEQVFERAVGQVNFPVPVQQQQSFQHGIEQDFLLRLRVERSLLLPAPGIFNLRRALLLLRVEFRPPPEMEAGGADNRDEGQGWPHGWKK
jgi:hypothetical protein